MNNEQYKLENVAAATNSEGGYCECPVCNAEFPAYLPFSVRPKPPRPNARCPKCGALERHRALALLMQKLDWHKENMRVLHFAPERIFYRLFSSFKDIEYWPVDLNPKMFGVKKAVDITNITFDDNFFDLIMCTHVLEHIPDDKKAMSELYRVLKPGGIALLNVPMRNTPATLENPEYNTPELRLKYYGQADHVRYYGLDFPDRLSSVGFRVQRFVFEDMGDKTLNKYGLKKTEKIFWCEKG